MKKIFKRIFAVVAILILCLSSYVLGEFFCYTRMQPKPITTYRLDVNTSNSAYGSVLGEGYFKRNEWTKIYAIAKDGYEFVQWQDGDTRNPKTVTITEDITYIATFKEITKYAYIESVQINMGDGWSLSNGQSIICHEWSLEINDRYEYGSTGSAEVILQKTSSAIVEANKLNGCRKTFTYGTDTAYVDNKFEVGKNLSNSWLDLEMTLTIAGQKMSSVKLNKNTTSVKFTKEKSKIEFEFSYPGYGKVIATLIYFVK